MLAAEGNGHVTSTVGVEHLTHRIISAAIWLAIVIFFAYGAMLRKNAIPGKDSEAPTAGGVSIAMQNAVNAAAAQARPAADNSGAGLMARVETERRADARCIRSTNLRPSHLLRARLFRQLPLQARPEF
jgi:hypothetical protein